MYLELTPPEIDPTKPILSDRAIWSKATSIPRPSQTVLMGELVDSSSRDHIMAHFWRTAGVNPESEVAMHRHGGDSGSTSGYAWFDGHASTDAFSETFDPSSNTDRWNPSDNKLFTDQQTQTHP